MKKLIDYLKEYKKLKSNKDTVKIRVAILSSFTTKGLKEVLAVKCKDIGVQAEIYLSDYNQYAQEILDNNSGLYEFNPDLVFLLIDTQTVLGDAYFNFFEKKEVHRKDLIMEKLDSILSLVKAMKKNTDAKIVVHNLMVPVYSPYGIIDNKQDPGLKEFVQKVNLGLNNSLQADEQIFVYDYDAFCSRYGKDKIVDYKLYFLGDIKLSLDYFPELCDEYLSYVKPIMALSKKCIVLDLDNTLWGGIIGEDGMDNIKLGPTPEGRPFWEFQKYLLALFNRGIILAVNSKNNLDDALEVFRNHPYMVLKEHHFASMRINWNDKISNMKEISKEINIGLDSMVFVDDDNFNREIVKDALPDVKVLEMPTDPSLYLRTLVQSNDFDLLQLTYEDRKKGKMYIDQRKRQQLKSDTTDLTEYLRGLEMTVTIEQANNHNIPRISQLTIKTNQFNMTTRRYSAEKIKEFAASKEFLVFCIKVEDKFGDNGITGAVIIKKSSDSWKIDSFLLSCRIIGRKIEQVLLNYIFKKAKQKGIKNIIAEYIPTKKNVANNGFYKDNGFVLLSNDNEYDFFGFDTSKKYSFPDFIKVLEVDNNGEA